MLKDFYEIVAGVIIAILMVFEVYTLLNSFDEQKEKEQNKPNPF